MSKQRNMWKHLGSLGLLGIMLLLALGSVESSGGSSGGSNRKSSSPQSGDKITAWIMAQQFVERSLKSPGSADYGGLFSDYQSPEDVVTDLGGGKYRVKAWVDAQNAFGAKLRNHFICELEHVGGDTWQLTSLVFLD